jgi:hypothetical protein
VGLDPVVCTLAVVFSLRYCCAGVRASVRANSLLSWFLWTMDPIAATARRPPYIKDLADAQQIAVLARQAGTAVTKAVLGCSGRQVRYWREHPKLQDVAVPLEEQLYHRAKTITNDREGYMLGLLVLNYGQAEAMSITGYTRGQAQYWLRKVTISDFHRGGLGGTRYCSKIHFPLRALFTCDAD